MMQKIRTRHLLGETIWRPRSGLSVFTALFSRRWWWATLVVLLGMAFLARLGFWQLDRLEQRRARNAEIMQQLSMPPLWLNREALPEDLTSLKYRQAAARGEFDFSHQVALMYQNWMDAPGIHLVAPLVIEGTSKAILVDRGWLPVDQAAPENWSHYDQTGSLTVNGFVQTSQTLPSTASNAARNAPEQPRIDWYRLDIEAIQAQIPYELLPVYILESPPGEGDTQLPYQVKPEFDLSDGPHLGYAIQWFIFAAILGVIYIRYVTTHADVTRRQETGRATNANF